MCNGGRFLFAVLNLLVRIKIRVTHSTLIIPSLTARRQAVAASIQKLPQTVVKPVSTARYTRSVNKAMRLAAYRTMWQHCGLALHMKVR